MVASTSSAKGFSGGLVVLGGNWGGLVSRVVLLGAVVVLVEAVVGLVGAIVMLEGSVMGLVVVWD